MGSRPRSVVDKLIKRIDKLNVGNLLINVIDISLYETFDLKKPQSIRFDYHENIPVRANGVGFSQTKWNLCRISVKITLSPVTSYWLRIVLLRIHMQLLKRQPIPGLLLTGRGFHPPIPHIKAHVFKPISNGFDV